MLMLEYKDNSILASEVTSMLNNRGVMISESAVNMVINAYIERKRSSLLEGYTVEERSIGLQVPSIRTCNTFVKGSTKSTAKIDFRLEGDLKLGILKNATNPEVLSRLGGTKRSKSMVTTNEKS